MSEQTMCYVAADPNQPGAAWAICVDNPSHMNDTAKEIGKWARQGAKVMRVDLEVGKEMLMKWERPERKRRASRS